MSDLRLCEEFRHTDGGRLYRWVTEEAESDHEVVHVWKSHDLLPL